MSNIVHLYDLVDTHGTCVEAVDHSRYFSQNQEVRDEYNCAGTFGSAGTFGGTFGTIGSWGCCC